MPTAILKSWCDCGSLLLLLLRLFFTLSMTDSTRPMDDLEAATVFALPPPIFSELELEAMPEWCDAMSRLTNSCEPRIVSLMGLVAMDVTDLLEGATAAAEAEEEEEAALAEEAEAVVVRLCPLELELRARCGESALLDLATVRARRASSL